MATEKYITAKWLKQMKWDNTQLILKKTKPQNLWGNEISALQNLNYFKP